MSARRDLPPDGQDEPLHKLRRKKGPTVRQLADVTGIDYSNLSRLEHNKFGDPKFGWFVNLAQALGVEPEAVISEHYRKWYPYSVKAQEPPPSDWLVQDSGRQPEQGATEQLLERALADPLVKVRYRDVTPEPELSAYEGADWRGGTGEVWVAAWTEESTIAAAECDTFVEFALLANAALRAGGLALDWTEPTGTAELHVHARLCVTRRLREREAAEAIVAALKLADELPGIRRLITNVVAGRTSLTEAVTALTTSAQATKTKPKPGRAVADGDGVETHVAEDDEVIEVVTVLTDLDVPGEKRAAANLFCLLAGQAVDGGVFARRPDFDDALACQTHAWHFISSVTERKALREYLVKENRAAVTSSLPFLRQVIAPADPYDAALRLQQQLEPDSAQP